MKLNKTYMAARVVILIIIIGIICLFCIIVHKPLLVIGVGILFGAAFGFAIYCITRFY